MELEQCDSRRLADYFTVCTGFRHAGGGSPDRRYAYVKLSHGGAKLLKSLAAAHRREIRKHAAEMIKCLTQLKK